MNFLGLDLPPCLCPPAVAVINAEAEERRARSGDKTAS